MKILLVVCLILGSGFSTPVQQRSFELESLLEHLGDGFESASKVVRVVHKIEELIRVVREDLPHLYHEYRDLIQELEEEAIVVIKDIKALVKSGYGFDLLDSLTSLTDGTQLGTVMRLLRLADKAHKFVNDLKHAKADVLDRVNSIVEDLEDAMVDLTHHVIRELSGGLFQQSAVKDVIHEIKHLFEDATEKTLGKVIDVVLAVETVIHKIENEFPEVYKDFRALSDDIRMDILVIVNDIKAMFQGYNFLDVVGSLTDGTKIGTVMKVVSLIDKFNTFVQHIKTFEPRAEAALERSVKIVADHTQAFLDHAAQLLSQY